MKSINAVPQKVDYKKFYTSPWGIVFIAYFVAMGLVGALTPADILKANPWARDFCDFMASYVSQIDKVTVLNIEPDINRFYFSVMWAGSPVLLILIMISFWQTRHFAASYKKGLLRMPFLKGLVFLLIAYLIFWMGPANFYWMSNKKIGILRAIFSNPLGRMVVAQCFVVAPIMFVHYSPIWLAGWLTGYIPRNIKKQNELEQLNK